MHFSYPLTVRGYELDSYGHVNNSVYLNYLEQARWELFRETGLLKNLQDSGLMLVVIDVHIRYLREVCLFDELVVETRCRRQDPYLVFDQNIIHAVSRKAMAKSTVKTLFLNKERIPQDIPAEMEKLYK
jgi:YbgC/YbaW family acyl-CoA thioester hydrolase